MTTASFETLGEGDAARLIARGTWTLECGLAALDARLFPRGAS